MRSFIFILLSAFLTVIMLACERNPLNVDISGIGEEIRIIRYEQELEKLPAELSMEEWMDLHSRFPDFSDLFTSQIIRIGFPDEDGNTEGLRTFLNDTMITSVYRLTERQFTEFDPIRKELVNAFKRYRYHFPQKPLPDVYTCISGFNESAFVAEGLIGISLDKYLGDNIPYYSMLGLPRYKQRKMVPVMIPSDAVYVWALGEFEMDPKASTLLDHMIHQGKIMYFMKAMLPLTNDTLITGFTEKQLKWCSDNEAQMWTYLIEKDMLYSTKQMDIVRYMNDGPQTNGFPAESPARTGAWLGWQIVKQYMKKHPDTKLPLLMGNHNYQDILHKSAYLP